MISINKTYLLAVASAITITACKVNKNSSSSNNPIQKSELSAVTVRPVVKGPYRETTERHIDLEHMKLAVSFNYQKQHVLGKAILIARPYFYDLKSVELDARGFDIKQVALLNGSDTTNLKYNYNGEKLLVFLDKTYTRKQSFKLFIDYVAKPNEIKGMKGVAIKDDKGLYFINPLGTEKDKPRQIWTQGETQSNSCWFPTIDAPNEKITQEIAITVDDKDITLSNGELMMSKNNPDGTRTDFWKQTKPHAPYLVMLAVGEFAQVKDYWRDSIAVDYYVEPEYKKYAKMVFGNTPEMMEVFSKKLGVDYPWNKYSQIVVRDFVSGAMENTSAVIHYDLLQHDHREHLDNPHEDIIAHELFHHWFGDLVTCESWSNIPLNESFATYGEYIWQENKYGLMEADCEFNNNLRAYLNQKNKHKVEPIRYHYGSRDDMFDVVSYQKGSLILHMLRKHIGDEAFFESLKLYLTKNAFKTAELADLRMAFEEVTGKDLNWFFNQWFLKAGHPVLEYNYKYNDNKQSVKLTITQKQDSTMGVYKLPIKVDVYTENGVKKESITVTEKQQTFEFTTDARIKFVNVDADRCLLAVIHDNKLSSEYKAAIMETPLFMDKYYAVNVWLDNMNDSITANEEETINYLLNHEFWGVRDLGLSAVEKLHPTQRILFDAKLAELAVKDDKSANRAEAVTLLAQNNPSKHAVVYQTAISDSAYSVVSAGLQALASVDSVLAKSYIQKFTHINNAKLQLSIAGILADYSTSDEVSYFERWMGKLGFFRFAFMNQYVQYLQMADKAVQQKAIVGLKNFYQTTTDKGMRNLMPTWINYMQAPWKDKLANLEEQKLKAKKDEAKIKQIDEQILEVRMMMDAYQSIVK